MGQWKIVIEPSFKARTFDNQQTEATPGVCALNRMSELGQVKFVRIL